MPAELRASPSSTCSACADGDQSIGVFSAACNDTIKAGPAEPPLWRRAALTVEMASRFVSPTTVDEKVSLGLLAGFFCTVVTVGVLTTWLLRREDLSEESQKTQDLTAAGYCGLIANGQLLPPPGQEWLLKMFERVRKICDSRNDPRSRHLPEDDWSARLAQRSGGMLEEDGWNRFRLSLGHMKDFEARETSVLPQKRGKCR